MLATAEALKLQDNQVELLFVGQRGGMEAKIIQASKMQFKSIAAGKFRRFHKTPLRHRISDLSSWALNIRDIARVAAGFFQSLSIIREFRPDVVFVKGGYVGLPVGLAAAFKKVPLVIHESDTIPGLTNKILSRWAVKIAVGFPVERYAKVLPSDKLQYTGCPVRASVLNRHRLEGVQHFRLSNDLPVVLVVGGSLGAQRINDAVIMALPRLLATAQVIHISGEKEIERVRFDVRRLGLGEGHLANYRLFAFLMEELGLALAAADVVVSRAGANAIAELAMLQKPSILIPNPKLVGGHQIENAYFLARRGAVRVITEETLGPDVLMAEITKVLESDEERAGLVKAISQFATPSAAKDLAQIILSQGTGE